MTRRRLRKLLVDAGIPVSADKTDGHAVHLVEFVDWWGVMPGVPGFGADTPNIQRVLTAANVAYEVRNMVMVAR